MAGHDLIHAFPGALHRSGWALAAALTAACATPQRPIDRILAGVPGAPMREAWIQADRKGQLPPIDLVSVPVRPVSLQAQATVTEPARPPPQAAPIQPGAVLDVRPFSLAPMPHYQGPFLVIRQAEGLLVGKLPDRKEPLELRYRLPGKRQQLAADEGTVFRLAFRDEVADSALQRSVVLSSAEGTTPFVYLAEGSATPYRRTFDDLPLSVEQLSEGEEPPVRVTYRDRSVVLKPGGRATLGDGALAVEAFLLESVAGDPRRTRLQEGQPYYVKLVVFRAR
jgi:hypothetical protein